MNNILYQWNYRRQKQFLNTVCAQTVVRLYIVPVYFLPLDTLFLSILYFVSSLWFIIMYLTYNHTPPRSVHDLPSVERKPSYLGGVTGPFAPLSILRMFVKGFLLLERSWRWGIKLLPRLVTKPVGPTFISLSKFPDDWYVHLYRTMPTDLAFPWLPWTLVETIHERWANKLNHSHIWTKFITTRPFGLLPGVRPDDCPN